MLERRRYVPCPVTVHLVWHIGLRPDSLGPYVFVLIWPGNRTLMDGLAPRLASISCSGLQHQLARSVKTMSLLDKRIRALQAAGLPHCVRHLQPLALPNPAVAAAECYVTAFRPSSQVNILVVSCSSIQWSLLAGSASLHYGGWYMLITNVVTIITDFRLFFAVELSE